MTCEFVRTRSPAPLFPDPVTGEWFDNPDGPANSHPEEWDLHLCPRAQLDSEVWVLVSAWMSHRWGGMAAGPLPAPGGSLDQTTHWIEACMLLDHIKADLEAHPTTQPND